MLNNLSGTNRSGQSTMKAATEETLKKLIKNLEEHVNRLNEDLNSMSEQFATETLNATSVNANDIASNTLSASSGSIDNFTNKRILTEYIESLVGKIDSLKSVDIEAETLKGQLIDVQNTLKALSFTTSNIHSSSIDSDIVRAQSVVTEALSLMTLRVEDIGANTADIDYGRIKELTSDVANIEEATINNLSSEKATITEVDVETAKAENATVERLVADKAIIDKTHTSVVVGTKTVNLDPQLNTEDDYYLVTIKKGFTTINLSVEDSFDATLTSAWVKNSDTAKNGATVMLLHQKEINQIVAVSDDENNVYIQIAPNNTNELKYHWTGKHDIEDIVTIEVNGTFEPLYFYKPARVAESIMLGYTDNGASDYRMSVLGEFKAAVRINEGTEELQDVAILNNLFVKDYFDETSGRWTYTAGIKDQYLSRFQDDNREMAWRSGADVNELGVLELTEDYTEEVYDAEGTFLGIRQVPGNKGSLLATKALEKWNGKVGTGRIVPYKQETFTFRPRYVSQPENESFILFCKKEWNIIDENNVMLGDLSIPGYTIRKDSIINPIESRHASIEITPPEGSPVSLLIDPNFGAEYEVLATYYKLEAVNPLTKLGTVDEGEWDAGAITSNESLTIKHDSITWQDEEYEVIKEPFDFEWVRK